MNYFKNRSNFYKSVLSCVDRPVNLLNDNLPEETKIDSHLTFEELKNRQIFENYFRYSFEQLRKRKMIYVIKSIISILLASLILSSIGTLFVLDFSKINPTWYVLIICELTVCPSLAVLIWKIRYQMLAKKNCLLQNMISVSLDLSTGDIVQTQDEFEEKYKKFMDESPIEAVKQHEYLQIISDTKNIRLCFSKLTLIQNKILGPLSENIAVEIILFVATFVVSAITFILDLMNNENSSTNLIITNCLVLSFALVFGIIVGLILADRSSKKAVEISVVRYLFYSYVTDAK